MTSRALVHGAITTNPAIAALIPPERWIQQGALDAPQVRPFGIIAYSDTPRSTLGSEQPRLVVWVHDDRGSYVLIDRVLDLVRLALESAIPLEDADSRIVDVEWTGKSAEFTDDQYDTNTRNTQFTLTGRK